MSCIPAERLRRKKRKQAPGESLMADAPEPVKLTQTPPNSIEAEQAVLGSMILDRDQIPIIIEALGFDDFYRESNGRIFEAILQLFEKMEPIDMVTLMNLLDKQGMLEKVGGAAYISTVVESCPTPANAASYARIVKDKAQLRQLIKAGQMITMLGFQDDTTDVEESIASSEQAVMNIALGRSSDNIIHIKPALKLAFESIQKKYQDRGGVSGIASGYKDLDQLTAGFQQSDLIIIAARPSMGKTSLALNIAQHVSTQSGKGVGIFSLEMSAEQLVTRMLCSISKVDASALRRGFLIEQDWNNLAKGMEILSRAPLILVDCPGVTTLELRAKTRRMQKEYGIEMVIIDYMQLITGNGRNKDNRVQEVSDISRNLKLMARELNMPVIVLSQLSRAVEQRQNKRPMLSDLRESGAIEQDADLVMFLYREGYYKQAGDEDGEADFTQPESDKTEINVAKHRNGPTGRLNLTFMHRYSTFENYLEEDD